MQHAQRLGLQLPFALEFGYPTLLRYQRLSKSVVLFGLLLQPGLLGRFIGLLDFQLFVLAIPLQLRGPRVVGQVVDPGPARDDEPGVADVLGTAPGPGALGAGRSCRLGDALK